MGKLLELLATKHNEWIAMTISFGSKRNPVSYDDASDIVQDMYIKMNNYEDRMDNLMFNETEINTMYIYLTLKTLFIDRCKYRSRNPYIETDEQLLEYEQIAGEEENSSVELSQMSLEDKIKEEISTWHHYDAKVFNIIFMEQVAMRKLSKETNISLASIFNTIKTKKAVLRNKFMDDYNQHIKNKQ